ncbi:Chromosome (plasmid) partitioning protein ParB [Caenispirillum salinarum AK4]|uniref:Chromosome (Plasmid) partitioning protein ParB n=1 Tax=Caenispirillum salinarum AK4 TaxID=1238182 RepID=K9H3Q4_9PROT|nr:ParB/RepB/Spo0J family partition protein [Caenispirillum salinarum]EKV32172.1 Chromosome (plasmid) partitioning protein ParB [Caenispirillum salinarum AK4]
MSAARRGLGRGLSALFGDEEDTTTAGAEASGATPSGPAAAGEQEQSDRLTAERLVPVGRLRSGRFQPRKDFDQQAIDDLAESIREKGIIQPILVRTHPDDADLFEIIAGERRWRAAQQAQLHEVPILVKAFTDREALEVALVENLQRQDLSPLEESEGYQRLMDEFQHTQDDLAKAVGKSRSHVANMMRLLALPDPVKGMLREGRLTAGHARALLNSENPEVLAERVVSRGLNVRQTEKLAMTEGKKQPRKKSAAKSAEKDADTLALERDLSQLLGLKVSITFAGRGGTLAIEYDTLEQLDDILHHLSDGAHRAPGSEDEEPLTEGEDLEAAVAADLESQVGEEDLKSTVWEQGLDALGPADVPEGAGTEDAGGSDDADRDPGAGLDEDTAAGHALTVEEAEAALADSLDEDSIDWSDDAVGDEDEGDAAFDPNAMKDVLREEGLDALYDEEADATGEGEGEGEAEGDGEGGPAEASDAAPDKDALREEGLDALYGSEETASEDDATDETDRA